MSWWNWSKTAASNASADPTINWAEGQPPASVNDSARAMMARIAEFRDDTSGLLVTSGTSTAYTLTSNQGLSATPNDGQLIAFSPHTPNGLAATITVDGGNTYPLQSTPGTALPAASLLQGTPYAAKFSVSAVAFVLVAFYSNPFNIPIGSMLPYVGITAPNANFAFPFGQAISRTTYATLFALTSTAFGTGDGSTTFNIPDLRGRTIFGQDNMGGSAANRITVAGGNFDGTVIGNSGGAQNHTLITAEMPSHSHTDTGHTHQATTYSTFNANTGGFANAAFNLTAGNIAITTASGTANLANTGGGGAHTVLSPGLIVPFILRII